MKSVSIKNLNFSYAEDKEVLKLANQTKNIIVINKIDVCGNNTGLKGLEISAQNGENIEEIKQKIHDVVIGEKIDFSGLIITNERHAEAINCALEEIEVYKTTSPDKYTKYYNHITTERVQYTYILLKVFSSSMSEQEINYYKQLFLSDAERNGLTHENEFHDVTIQEIFK